MLVTLGLTGLVLAQNEPPVWKTPNKLSLWLPTITEMPDDSYVDLSELDLDATNNFPEEVQSVYKFEIDEGVTVLNECYAGVMQTFAKMGSAEAEEGGIEAYPLVMGGIGVDPLAEGTGSGSQAMSLVNFLETPITCVLFSAAGLYMDDGEVDMVNYKVPNIMGDPLGTDLANIHAKYAVVVYPYHYKNYEATLIEAKAHATKDPVTMALCSNDDGEFYIIAQYNYMVDEQEWSYQIMVSNEGVSIHVDELACAEDDEIRFAVGFKLNDDMIMYGNAWQTSATACSRKDQGWIATNLKNHMFSFSRPYAQVQPVKASYTTASADVLVSDKGKTVVEGKDIIAFTTDNESLSSSVNWPYETEDFQVGDQVGSQFPVVYRGTPTLTSDNTFSVNCTNLTPGEEKYLQFAYGYQEEGTWHWDYFATSAQFTTLAIDAPEGVTAGTPSGNNLPLTITSPAANNKMMVVKSAYAQSIAPKGKLEVGDTYENTDQNADGETETINTGKVVAFLEPGATAYNLEMTPGEAAYVHIYGVVEPGTDNAAYSADMVLAPVYLPATALPLSYTFSDKDVLEQPSDAMPVLPPGMGTGTVLPTDEDEAFLVRNSAFFVQTPGRGEDYYLTSSYGYSFDEDNTIVLDTRWNDVIAPAFSGAARVVANFRVKIFEPGMGYGSVTNHTPVKGDSVRLDYRLNGQAWQTAKLFTATGFPDADAGVYKLTAEIKCAKTDKVEIRYSYRTTTYGVKHAIISYEFLEARDCETPTDLQIVNDGTTDKAIALKWTDRNLPATGKYVVSYRKIDEADDAWETLEATAPEALLRNLETNTAYNVKVHAVCADESSYTTDAVRMSTLAGMPYVENMVWADFNMSDWTYGIMPNVTVYSGEPGDLKEANYMQQAMGSEPASWNALQCETITLLYEDDPDALAVSTMQDKALLATPAIYTRKADKTLKFRVNTFTMDPKTYAPVEGIDLEDEDLRLYVLVSTDGKFTWNDTVKAFDHNDLKAAPATENEEGEEGEETTERGKELSIALDKYNGLVQIGFYFHNPNKPDMGGIGGYSLLAEDEEEEEEGYPKYLEIRSIALDYNGDPCFPVENLEATKVEKTTATLVWNGEGAEYGVTYYPADDKTKAKTQRTEKTTMTLEGLTSNTAYKAEVISYCTKGAETGSAVETVEFKTTREMFEVKVTITPEDAGKVEGAGSYFDGEEVSLTATANKGYKFVAWMDGEKELTKDATHTFIITANVNYTAKFEAVAVETYELTLDVTPAEAGTVKGEGKYEEGADVEISATANKGYRFVAWMDGEKVLQKDATYSFKMPAEDVTYTAVFEKETGIEDMVKANFSVSTDKGQLIVRNLNGLTVKDIDVYGLTGNRINRFTLNSREDLMLPINAGHALIFVRINSEKGVAIYKVYLH